MPPCRNGCGRPAKALTHGYCNACNQRWVKAGRPESGPPAPAHAPPTPKQRAAINAVLHRHREERVELFRKLDRDKLITDREIASYMKVNVRTVWRYRAAERAAGRGWWKPMIGPRTGKRD